MIAILLSARANFYISQWTHPAYWFTQEFCKQRTIELHVNAFAFFN